MRKLITILALLGLAAGFTALTASADTTTVTYTVDGTFSASPPFSTTAIANPGDSFTLTLSVPSDALGPDPLPTGMSGNIGTTFTFTNLTDPSLSLSQTCAPTVLAPCLNFFTPAQGGLFSLEFTGPGGDIFEFELLGAGCITSPMPTPADCGGYTDGTPPTLITGGPFTLDDSFSTFAELTPDGLDIVGANGVSGTATATPSTTPLPEPSSLLLLGSGFLALGGFARKRLVTLFN